MTNILHNLLANIKSKNSVNKINFIFVILQIQTTKDNSMGSKKLRIGRDTTRLKSSCWPFFLRDTTLKKNP